MTKHAEVTFTEVLFFIGVVWMMAAGFTRLAVNSIQRMRKEFGDARFDWRKPANWGSVAVVLAAMLVAAYLMRRHP